MSTRHRVAQPPAHFICLGIPQPAQPHLTQHRKYSLRSIRSYARNASQLILPTPAPSSSSILLNQFRPDGLTVRTSSTPPSKQHLTAQLPPVHPAPARSPRLLLPFRLLRRRLAPRQQIPRSRPRPRPRLQLRRVSRRWIHERGVVDARRRVSGCDAECKVRPLPSPYGI